MTEMNIYQKLAKIRKNVEVIQKNKSGYGYKYVTDDELLAKISGFMDKYGVSLIPSVTPGTMNTEPYTYKKTKQAKDKGGNPIWYEENVNEVMVNGEMQYTWVNNDKPEEKIVVNWYLVGHQSDGSQSFGSALTYSMRYFLLKYFSIATPDDDPDNWRSKQKAAEAAEEKAIAAQFIEQVNALVTNYLSSNQNQKETVREFICRYVKSGDYFKITEPTLAAKLLEDFKTQFIETKGE